jgi:hypothetical protein
MSLRGYVKKGKPAVWQSVSGAQPTRGPATFRKSDEAKRADANARRKAAHDDRQRGALGSRRFAFKARKDFKRVAPVSKRRQAVTAEYRREARAFVRAAVARGETCRVVAAIPELRDGMKYGWPVKRDLNEVHHTRGRAGSLLMDQRFWIPLSKAGHRWVHENMAEARAREWICEAGLWNKPERSAP